MLNSRCILSSQQENDGKRISIMSRHTLSDGQTKDPRITDDLFDLHLTDLAPPQTLISRWYRGDLGKQNEINFVDRFAPEYIKYLETQYQLILIIGKMALRENVTVMCIEPEVEENKILLCHRRLLVEKCKILIPELAINIR